MNIFLHDPNEIRLPPEEVRLNKVQITPQPGGSRIKITLELTPFMKRPNISVTITTPTGEEVAHSNILETRLPKLEFSMHLRQVEPGSKYTIETSVYYQKLPQPNDESKEVPLPDPVIVDYKKSFFIVPQLED
ncbi:MAG: hypothetical protein WAV05_16715 [Anaerolineales bacterium]